MIILINLLSFFLDGIISLFNNKNSILIPLFSVMSLIVIYPLLKNKLRLILVGIILGLLYDIVYTQTLFLNTINYLLLTLIILTFYKYLSYNITNSFILSFIILLSYRVISYLSFVILYDVKFDINLLFKSIYSSLIMNFIYMTIANIIFYVKKVKNKKPDKYYF